MAAIPPPSARAHVAVTDEVSEPSVWRTIRHVEAPLLAWGQFALPGKKVLQASPLAVEVVIVDATQVPIERPKKSKGATTGARKSGTRTKPKS